MDPKGWEFTLMRPVGLSLPVSWIPAPVRGREDQNEALWFPKLQFTRFPCCLSDLRLQGMGFIDQEIFLPEILICMGKPFLFHDLG